jgi:hypothetical protein
MKNSDMKRLNWRRAGLAVILTGLVCALGRVPAVFAAGVSLDENEEIQWVMGDLSALKTAAHTYYSENGQTGKAPSLSEVLQYFDEDSLPPNAASLYAVRSGVKGWYVGYRAAGLKDETYRLLHENANTLELVCDDLRSPWKRGSSYIWSLALPLNAYGASTPQATIRGSDAAGTAAVMLGTAILLNIIDDHRRGGYTYCYPREPWRWRSGLAYRHAYRDRFFGRPHRSLPSPRMHHRPIFRPRHETSPYRGPSRWDHDRRSGGGGYRQEPRLKPPAHRPGGERRPEHFRNGSRPGGPRSEGRRPGAARPGRPEFRKRPESPSPRREAPPRGGRGDELRREEGRGEGGGRGRHGR